MAAVALTPAFQAAAQEPVTLRFDIQRYQVEGNTLLAPEQIERIVASYTGKQRDFGDIQKAIEALELAYRAAGFSAVTVYLPEQEVERGVVTIKVIEARIRNIEVAGNRFFTAENIRRSIRSLREGESPNAASISADVSVANENPAKKVNVTLRSGDKEGQVDARVDVTDENPRRFFVTLDNTGNPQTGMYRLGVGFQHANLFDRDHALTVQYITSPEKTKQVSIYSIGYRAPLYGVGDSLDLFAGYSDVDAGTTTIPAGSLQFSGQGNVYGIRYNYILPRRGEYDHRMVFGFDYRAFKNSCRINLLACIGVADVTVRPASVTYSGQWTGTAQQTALYATLARNLPGGEKGSSADFEAARPLATARADYALVRFGASHFRVYPSDWQARVAVNAQYTPHALVPGEQFGIGGASTVRGFLERELANDKGYFANVELYTPELGARLGLGGTTMRGLLFFDYGEVRRNNVLPGEIAATSISSAGAGLRVNLGRDLSLRLDVAQVRNQGATQRANSARGHLALLLNF